jgi:hypothetical protein
MYSSSFGCSLALIGTATSPACQQANIASAYAGQFFITRPTRSPGAKRAASPPARRATRAANSA